MTIKPQITLRFKADIRPMEAAIETVMGKPAYKCRPWVEFCTHGFDEDQKQADAIEMHFPSKYEDDDGVKPTLMQFMMIIACALPHCGANDTQFDIVAQTEGVSISSFTWDDRWDKQEFDVHVNFDKKKLNDDRVSKANETINEIWRAVQEYHGAWE